MRWGLSFRSSIRHPYAFWTNKPQHCSIDYSKAVVIEDEGDIDKTRVPHLRDDEFIVVKGREREIAKGFMRYVRTYRAARTPGHPRYRNMLKFSTLQNYEDLLGLR